MSGTGLHESAEQLLSAVEAILRATLAVATTSRGSGATVHLAGHLGDAATDVDLAASNAMTAAAQSIFPGCIAVTEETPARWKDVDEHDVVWVGDPLDGTKQHRDLGAAYCVAGSLHLRTGDTWDMVAAGIVTSSGEFVGSALGRTSDIYDQRPATTITGVAVGASKPADVHLLAKLAAAVPADARIWNVGGNPTIAHMVRHHAGITVQPRATTQWDSIGVAIAHQAGFAIYRLDRPTLQSATVSSADIRAWFGQPKLGTKPVPPLVVGPDDRHTTHIWTALADGLATAS